MPRASLVTATAGVIALLIGAAACQTAAPQPPAATAAAPISLSGTVDRIVGRVATITTTAAGTQEVTLPEGVTLEQEGKGTVADLKPGLSVGVTGKPDGTAISIRIFQASTTVRPGQLPMAGAQAGNTMTNAVIQSFDGDTLTVQLGEQRVPLKLPAGTEVLKPVSAALSDLSAGKRVNVTAVPTGPNGALIATSVYVPGAPPPIAR